MDQSSEMYPPVSVIIPSYKARNYLGESLSSVATQDYTGILEVLVIDDASPEPIDDIIATYLKLAHAHSIRVIRHEKNQGLGASRNTGIKESRGEYIAFLDHDDVWAPNHISNLMSQIQKDRADLAFCSVVQFETDLDKSLGLWGPPENTLDENFVFTLFKMSYITPSATLIRRDILLSLKGFSTDPSVHMCEDLDLWLRMIHNGAKISYSKTPSAYYRKHPAAATSRPGYMAYQSAYVRQIHVNKIAAPWLQKRSIVARSWWASFNTLAMTDRVRFDVLWKAFHASMPVPLELGRGVVRLYRLWLKTAKISQPSK